MLDLGHDPSLTAICWDALELKTRLPERMSDFFEPQGPMPIRPDDRRTYHRFYLRSKAVLCRKDACLGVYTADASRQGMRILSPVQLLPKERCRIWLPSAKEFQVQIARCRRIDDRCYDCGATFILGN